MVSLRLRQATIADRPFLDELFAVHHRGEFALLGLPEDQLGALLAMQSKAQRSGYARDYPDAIDQLVLNDEAAVEAPTGRILVARRSDAFYLVDIALMPGSQGWGIGTALVQGLIEEAERSGLPIRLHVRPGNRAFHLYTRLGFKVVGAGADLEMEYRSAADAAELMKVEEKLDERGPAAAWECEIGSLFQVHAEPAGDAPPMKLTRVQSLGGTSSRGFVLNFQTPREFVFPQATYAVRKLESSESPGEELWQYIFLVPVGPVQEAMEYEAIFNLL